MGMPKKRQGPQPAHPSFAHFIPMRQMAGIKKIVANAKQADKSLGGCQLGGAWIFSMAFATGTMPRKLLSIFPATLGAATDESTGLAMLPSAAAEPMSSAVMRAMAGVI